jgi:hypothetical protein
VRLASHREDDAGRSFRGEREREHAEQRQREHPRRRRQAGGELLALALALRLLRSAEKGARGAASELVAPRGHGMVCSSEESSRVEWGVGELLACARERGLLDEKIKVKKPRPHFSLLKIESIKNREREREKAVRRFRLLSPRSIFLLSLRLPPIRSCCELALGR